MPKKGEDAKDIPLSVAIDRSSRDLSVAVAVDKDRSCQYALKWAVENILDRGQPLSLIHIKTRTSSTSYPTGSNMSDPNDVYARSYKQQLEQANKELFLPFRCFCTKKEIRCKEVIYESSDVSKGIVEFVASNNIEVLVLGAATKGGLFRFKSTDVPGSVLKSIPSFCTVYVISKTKISNVKQATISVPYKRSTPVGSARQPNNPQQNRNEVRPYQNQVARATDRNPPVSRFEDIDIRSPFNRPGVSVNRSYERSTADSDISYVSSGSSSIDHQSLVYFDSVEGESLSSGSEFDARSYDNISQLSSGNKSMDTNVTGMSMDMTMSETSGQGSMSAQNVDDVEAEMRRLRLELKQTIDMYSNACKEALTAKEKAKELQRWKMEEQQKLAEARIAGEAALEIAEREKAKCKAALEAAGAAKKIAEREAQKRINAEKKALKEAEEKKKIMNSIGSNEGRYRRYSIEEIKKATDNLASARKIGEGGYGPVYKCYLDHTPVAIKVLRPDAAQGRSQFQQEVEILCSIRHPNMVLLLGACPEYGCLVYEYMANGSLEDRLFRRGKTPVIPWQVRFRIAAEIGMGLLFLHQTKPEPLVHRDLKPANILLDQNYVSKISDVGLARLVPPSIANAVTQYRMTSTAGTFCYIDPEYQQTGMLGIKSDIYSLGILLLQIITAKPPMGLTHVIEGAIEGGNFAEVLDPAVPDWPIEEALKFAKLALRCAEIRRKDRPDLRTAVLPELNRWRTLGAASMPNVPHYMISESSPRSNNNPSSTRTSQEMMSGPSSGLDSVKSKADLDRVLTPRAVHRREKDKRVG